MLKEPGKDVVDVEDRAVRGTDWGVEGLEGDGAEAERETLKGCTGGRGFCETGACAGGEGIFGGPLTVGNLNRKLVAKWIA